MPIVSKSYSTNHELLFRDGKQRAIGRAVLWRSIRHLTRLNKAAATMPRKISGSLRSITNISTFNEAAATMPRNMAGKAVKVLEYFAPHK